VDEIYERAACGTGLMQRHSSPGMSPKAQWVLSRFRLGHLCSCPPVPRLSPEGLPCAAGGPW
jgi:hypothetical protein